MNRQLNKTPFGRGFINDILTKIRLTFNLVKDERVPLWLKAIPVFSLLYLIMPIDLLFGPVDDALIIYIGMDLFIDLCPREIVSQYLAEIEGKPPSKPADQVVDVEFREK